MAFKSNDYNNKMIDDHKKIKLNKKKNKIN